MREIPASLGEAIATEPAWLQGWVFVLIVTNLASILFVAAKTQDRWIFRPEALAIFISFFLASALMGFIYEQFGYVRLLGAAHLVFWTPAFIWVWIRRPAASGTLVYSKYLVVYLVVAGLSLAIDAIDVIRYLIGDGELFNRWQ